MLNYGKLKTLQLFIVSLIYVQTSLGQSHIYEHFSVDEGLASSEVYDIYQDKFGYIWFATDKGLSRFNGYEFENFTTQNGLPDNVILDFYPQSNGQVWCYGYNSQSLFYFNETFDGFHQYKYNHLLKNELQPHTVIKSVIIENNGAVLVGGYGLSGFVEITKKGETRKYYDSSIHTKFFTTGVDTTNNLFFSIGTEHTPTKNIHVYHSTSSPSSRADVAFINDNYNVFIDRKLGIVKNGKVTYYEIDNNPLGVKRIDNHSFWVGFYKNGVEKRDLFGRILEKYLPTKSVSNFLIDAEGSYWFSTIDDGVFYIKNPCIRMQTEKHISSLVKNQHNTLYAGFNNGDIGLLTNNYWHILTKGQNTNHALVEFDSDNGNIWGYSDGSLTNYTSGNKPISVSATKLPEVIGGPLLSAVTNFIFKMPNDTVIRHYMKQKTHDLCAYNQKILIGTSSGLYVQQNDTIQKHQPHDLLKLRIDDIDLNPNNNTLYMASQGAGLIVYGDSIYNIGKSHGLTNDIVNEVHIENDSTVWACTSSGLNQVVFKSNKTFKVSTITKADGLLSNDIDDVEIINDTVWVATKKGLCRFSKQLLFEKEKAKPISLFLAGFTANQTLIDKEQPKFANNQNNIDFKLQAISHKNINHINYLYRLKEVDTTWISTKNRNISFPSLSPGKYTFQAKVLMAGSLGDDVIERTFIIRPPFWKSWWFYGLCFFPFSGLIYLFFRIRVLTYNQDVIRELIRLAIKRLTRKELYYQLRQYGEDFKVPTNEIQYINSKGNYLDIVTLKKKYTIRCKIGDFINTTPDALEYLRVHRSYIIRIDQVTSKGKNWINIDDQKIPVGEKYLPELEKIQF